MSPHSSSALLAENVVSAMKILKEVNVPVFRFQSQCGGAETRSLRHCRRRPHRLVLQPQDLRGQGARRHQSGALSPGRGM